MDGYNIIIIFTAVSFISYGINSFISHKMILEFKRWGLEKRRKEIGSFQFVCGVGILLGLKYTFILIASSIILIIMMIVAVYIRIKIKDNISEILPAIAYLVLGIIILQHIIWKKDKDGYKKQRINKESISNNCERIKKS